MKLVEKYMQERTELNITGNGGTHYNGVMITAVYDDFITVEPSDTAARQAGQYRGGPAHVNLYMITRLEEAALASRIRGDLLGR
jgi:hypothetical protein